MEVDRTAEPIWGALSPAEYGTVRTSDGFLLQYQVFPPRIAPATGEEPVLTVVLANGIGVRFPGFAMQIEHLRKNYRVVAWDYRGIGASGLAHQTIQRRGSHGSGGLRSGEKDPPHATVTPPAGEVDFSIERHALDLLEVVDSMGIEKFAIVGWSMGVQVGLEVIRQRPSAVLAFAALFGTYGRPFHKGLPAPLAEIIEGLFRVARDFSEVVGGLVKLAAWLPELSVPLLKGAGFISSETVVSLFLSNVQDVAEADHGAYLATMSELARHNAHDMLSRITCPSLIITGSKDYLTPPAAARDMADQITDCELMVLEGASHFGLIEPCQAIQPALDALLRRVL